MAWVFAEMLESRQLLSGTVGPPTVFDAAVRTDELHVFQVFSQFKKDGTHSNAAFLKDANAIKGGGLTQAPTVKPLLGPFASAVLGARSGLDADKLHETPAVVADEKAILAELKKIARDKNNPTALAADQTQLTTDRTQVKTDLDTEIQNRITGRENVYNTVLDDAESITSAITSDTQASAKLTAASTKLGTDAQNCATALGNDLQQVQADGTQLDTDLTASNS